MAFSLILRLGGGLILPNKTEVTEQNNDDKVDGVIKDSSDREELRVKLSDKQEDEILKLYNTGNSKSTSTHWIRGDGTKLMSKETENGTGAEGNEKWYTFLEDLYNKFSEYVILKDRQKYNVANLDDWGQTGKPQGISVTPETFKKFLDKIGNLNVTEYETIKNLNATTGQQIEELNQVMSLTLKHKPTIMCSEPHIIIKGVSISINETLQSLMSNSDTHSSCKNFRANLKPGIFTLFKFFALNKVFIDADLSLGGKEVSIVLIAPQWEVIGSRSIELDGSDGTRKPDPKAKNGAHPGNNGVNGSPGNPGVTGESFFGIGSTFVGGQNLKIISNGGKGGLGQDGGDGAVGVAGKDAPKPSRTDPPCIGGRFGEYVCGRGSQETIPGIADMLKITNYNIYGMKGSTGGRGGDGGKGGNGGDSGKIEMLELSQPSKITQVTSKGKEGENGKGGAGGPGGRYGDHAIGKYKEHTVLQWCFTGCTEKYWENLETRPDGGIGPNGSKGTDGGNAKDIKGPAPAKGISRPANIINEYKMYLRENLNSRFQKPTLLQFLDILDSKNEVRKLYDILALIDEFQDLEEQSHKLRAQMDVSPFYNSLLERISAFAKGQKDIPDSNESRKVLNYLYTATLGRLDSLKENSEPILIIDMRAYLNMVEDNIKKLKNVQTINNKVDVVNKYKDSYKSGIETKIKEAQSLIEKQINPEMENIDTEIDNEVNTLVQETIAMQEEAEVDLKKLEEKKKELEKAMALKGMFSCFKIIGGAVSLLGPEGQMAGAVIDVASTVGDSFAVGDTDKILNIPADIEKSVTTLKDQVKAMRDEKVSYLNKIIKNISAEIKKNPEKLGDMEKKIEGIKDKLQKVSDNELDFKHVGVLEKELEESIRIKGLELKTHSSDEKSIDALKAWEKFTQVLQFGSLFATMHAKMKEDKAKVDVITKSIEETKDKIELLKDYERNIYDTIAPMLQEMEDHMKDISAKLGTKSQVSLDVTKWQVQSTLKDMKLQMQGLTEGKEVKGEISRSIEKLDEVMTTMINVYDRIQSYQEKQNMANFIADISSVAASSINIKDQQLANAVDHLESAIRANIVLEQYKSATNALEQWVFPFADRYIESYMLPSQLQLNANIENLVETATRQIGTIKQKLDLYDASIMKGDQFLECEEFSSQYLSSQPFFVWENEKNRESISSLLSGEEVVLKADVRDSVLHKDAIKFSEIDFHLKIKNDTVQSLLTDILKGFDIKATHLGNSYYRYANNITVITSDSATISYSYEKNNDGIPIRSNEVYGRLKSGDLLLSPYALWDVKMINKTNKYSFKDLEKFKGDVNVELSGLGSYVDTSEGTFSTYKTDKTEKNSILSLFQPERAGLNSCKRSKYRSARSVSTVVVNGDFMTNDASKGISSPINYLCNFLKSYFVSNLVVSMNRVFFGDQTSVRKNSSELSDECTETRKTDATGESNATVGDTDTISAENDYIKERRQQNSDVIFDVIFIDTNSCSKSFLLSDRKVGSDKYATPVPDLNCSLLLADLVTRTITRNRYKSSSNECLLSPREVVLGKISDGVVRSESDVKQMLHRHLSEKEQTRQGSWFSKLDDYSKLMLKFLGFNRVDDSEEYFQDVRHLFT